MIKILNFVEEDTVHFETASKNISNSEEIIRRSMGCTSEKQSMIFFSYGYQPKKVWFMHGEKAGITMTSPYVIRVYCTQDGLRNIGMKLPEWKYLHVCNFIKSRFQTGVSWEYCENFKNTYFEEHLRTAVFCRLWSKISWSFLYLLLRRFNEI